MSPSLIDGLAFVPAAWSLAWGSWWALTAALAVPRPHPPAPAADRRDTVVIIPAHNEERTLSPTLQRLAASTLQPTEVIVVADNCTDATAEVARAHGATVLERRSEHERGKPFALNLALSTLRDRGAPPEVVVLVDADTEVAPDCLERLVARIAGGAMVVQAYYQGAPGGSRLAGLRRLALALVHWARPLGAARLGLGATLKGNGMAFRWEVVQHGFAGSGITEDAALTLELVRRRIPITFEPTALVTGLMAGDYDAASTQDQRWEGGRFALARRAYATAARALLRGDIAGAGSALEVGAPPLSLVGGAAVVAMAASALGGRATLPVAAASVLSLVGYVFVGFAAARVSRGDLGALLGVPRFLIHKAAVYLRLLKSGAPQDWVRTER
ncbi:MAG: glycosyltransferase [Dehalococcoidia bacterium]|nr:glycosyltransferase [Dehalococcoidia bacterium]